MIPIVSKPEKPPYNTSALGYRRGPGSRSARVMRRAGLACLTVLALAAAGCGSSSSGAKGGTSPGMKPHAGGTYTILANSNFGTADPAQNYTLEEWQLLITPTTGSCSSTGWAGCQGPSSYLTLPR